MRKGKRSDLIITILNKSLLTLVRKDARIKKRPDIGPTFVVDTFKLNNTSRLLSQFRFMETAFLMEPKQKEMALDFNVN